jgi:hypothetical protein
MEDKTPNIELLKTADFKAYANLCEKAGCYSAALEYYSNSNQSLDLLHAAELAKTLDDSKQVRKFCGLARKLVNSELNGSKIIAEDPVTSGMGAGLAYASSTDRRKKVYFETLKLIKSLK